MGDYPGERLVDFVRDGGYQFSHGHHSGDMREIRLRLAQGFFGPLSLLDVGARAVPPQDAPLLIPQRIVSDQEPAIPSVFSPYSCLHLDRGTVGKRPLTGDL